MNPGFDVVGLYEYPLPVLSTDIDRIEAESSDNISGSLIVRNKGGGSLAGKILSNSKAIHFSPENFSGKNVEVQYYLDLSFYKPGDELRTSAVIMSNGGEKTIPVIVKVIPARIETKEGGVITSVSDFAVYSNKNPISARHLFLSNEFANWLLAIHYPHMDSYEELLKDPNKERALDNFLIISGLKEKSRVVSQVKRLVAIANPYDKNPFVGDIRLERIGWGYIDCPVRLKNDSKWIKMGKDRLTDRDFDINGRMSLSFYISTAFLTASVCCEKIMIDDETVTIYAKAPPPLSVTVSRESFTFEDSGLIYVQNNTGKDITIEVSPEDTFLKFEGKRYLVGRYAEIPFDIKLSALQSAQFRFMKQPVIPTGLYVRAGDGYINFQKRLTFAIGQIWDERKKL